MDDLPSRLTRQARKNEIPFGLKDGNLLHVTDVPNGKDCGCICPGCKAPLVAVNNVRKRIPHFRHLSGSACITGYESAIHLAGKDALLRHKTVDLPHYNRDLNVFAKDGRLFQDHIEVPSYRVVAEQAFEEVTYGDFKPDVVFHLPDRKLFIEIKKTHAVDDQKKQKIKALGIAAIEIDLSQIEPEALRDHATFDQTVISDLSKRHWLYSSKIEALYKIKMQRLRAQRDHYEAQEHERRLAEAEERKRMQKVAEAKRAQRQRYIQSERDRIKLYIDELERSMSPEWLLARAQQFSSADKAPVTVRYLTLGIESLFLKGEAYWLFNTSFKHWQACVLELFFAKGARRRRFTYKDVYVELMQRFGAPAFVTALRKLRYTHPVRITNYSFSLSPGDTYLLTKEQNKAIPKDLEPVKGYLDHLLKLGVLIKPRLYAEDVFEAAADTVEAALEVQRIKTEKHRQDEIDRFKRIKKSEEDKRQKRNEQRLEQEAHVTERIYAIRASEFLVYQQHRGRGLRCDECQLLSPPGTSVCDFCNGQIFRDEVITSHRIEKNRFILLTSPRVMSSLTAVPNLDYAHLKQVISDLKADDKGLQHS
ncbi:MULTISPECIES: competence protein CoiA family protein [Pseudomonas]|uniref:Competence protein n=1 Tax=Pseudomonas luteola TaxID=47886 RepID=A0ABS0MXS6_PSELU|nr:MULTISPECIES: competence protein CoiA family protein [Pseudomonas]MBA1250374.1 hypothetical protein [Pseudomonas zeshuii]MBH3441446.1 hypothetical protein [Pseudomonas luteola]QEU26610.1 hypothetical protein FOB45_01990 [Pseudomonas luteola]